jgi:DNA-binding transcriptional regulator LsrR (DeoR family)
VTTVPTASTRAQDALRAAQLYYLQDLTMEAIAQELHTSRSSVSRLLGYARESGLVDIQVRSPHDMPSRLEAEFRDRFGVTAHTVNEVCAISAFAPL